MPGLGERQPTKTNSQLATRHALSKDTPLDTTPHTLILYCPILLVFSVTYATGVTSDMRSSVPQPGHAGLPKSDNYLLSRLYKYLECLSIGYLIP